jgi:glycerate dehydrogenase
MKIIVLDGYTLNPGDLNWDGLRKFGEVDIYDRTPADFTLERAKDAEILIVNKHKVDASLIDQLVSLKLICITATGFNNVDTEYAKSKNIPVCNVRGYGTSAVAQHVFAMIFNFQNRVQQYSNSVNKGDWAASGDFSYTLSPIREIERKVLGIYGFGRIGQRVAELAQAFNMNVIATHKHPLRDRRPGVQFVHLEELFETADYISLHAPLNPDNAGIINARLLKLMKPSAYLINTSRGSLINELDLREALEDGKIAGAALDVLSSEPPSESHPLVGIQNCIITPHIAWASVEARQRLMNGTVENVKAFLNGNPRNVVNE